MPKEHARHCLMERSTSHAQGEAGCTDFKLDGVDYIVPSIVLRVLMQTLQSVAVNSDTSAGRTCADTRIDVSSGTYAEINRSWDFDARAQRTGVTARNPKIMAAKWLIYAGKTPKHGAEMLHVRRKPGRLKRSVKRKPGLVTLSATDEDASVFDCACVN